VPEADLVLEVALPTNWFEPPLSPGLRPDHGRRHCDLEAAAYNIRRQGLGQAKADVKAAAWADFEVTWVNVKL
jgi:hypothetical protein